MFQPYSFLSVRGFSGRSSSAPLHMKNRGTAARDTDPQKTLEIQSNDRTGNLYPADVVWMTSTPRMAMALMM